MDRFKQPREDIVGTDRSDSDLLSLDMVAVAHREALIAMAWHLRDATMVGHPAPIAAQIYQRLKSPQPGDLVVEPGMAVYSKDLDTRIKALGYLIEKREEWWLTDEDWEALKVEDGGLTDEDRQTDEAWYIQYGPDPADICRWVNCTFITVPIRWDEFRTRPANG